MEHIAYIAEFFDASLFAFLVMIDVHKLSPLLAFTEYLRITHEIIGANDFAVVCEPLNDFRCGHMLAKVDFVVEHHNVGTPEFLSLHALDSL